MFEVRATTLPLNGQSMTESPAAEYTWTIDAADTTDPDTTIQLGPANSTTNTSATFLFGGTDNLTAPADLTFECSLDGAAFADCQSGDVYDRPHRRRRTPSQVRAIRHGRHAQRRRARRRVRVDDRGSGREQHAGGYERRGVRQRRQRHVRRGHGRRLHVGLGADRGLGARPADRATSAAGAIYYDVSTTATFVGDVTVCLPYDTLVGAHVLHFDGEWADVTLEQQGGLVCGVVSSLSPFAVAEASADVAPDTTIVQAPADPTIQSTGDGAEVQFQFASTIDTPQRPAEFECRLDAEAWSSCDTPYRFNALFGEHTLRVRAVTDAGVLDATPAVYTWTVLARPVATIESGPADQAPGTPDIENESRTATFEFSSDQVGSTFECRLTGEATGTTWQACTSPRTYEDLALGEYTFEVQAIKAGNASFLPAQFEWEVADLTAPVVTIDERPVGHRRREDGEIRLLGQRAGDLRVLARRRTPRRVPVRDPVHRPRPRPAHVHGPGDRPVGG